MKWLMQQKGWPTRTHVLCLAFDVYGFGGLHLMCVSADFTFREQYLYSWAFDLARGLSRFTDQVYSVELGLHTSKLYIPI